MTRNDTDRIAEILAYCEAHCDNDQEFEIVTWVADKFAEALAADMPRFNAGRFEVLATPIRSQERKRAILESLK